VAKATGRALPSAGDGILALLAVARPGRRPGDLDPGAARERSVAHARRPRRPAVLVLGRFLSVSRAVRARPVAGSGRGDPRSEQRRQAVERGPGRAWRRSQEPGGAKGSRFAANLETGRDVRVPRGPPPPLPQGHRRRLRSRRVQEPQGRRPQGRHRQGSGPAARTQALVGPRQRLRPCPVRGLHRCLAPGTGGSRRPSGLAREDPVAQKEEDITFPSGRPSPPGCRPARRRSDRPSRRTASGRAC
jgi:hypothetical protein